MLNMFLQKHLFFTSETILYVQWITIANCTVEFDVNGDYDPPENERSITTMFNQEIREFSVISRRGYITPEIDFNKFLDIIFFHSNLHVTFFFKYKQNLFSFFFFLLFFTFFRLDINLTCSFYGHY